MRREDPQNGEGYNQGEGRSLRLSSWAEPLRVVRLDWRQGSMPGRVNAAGAVATTRARDIDVALILGYNWSLFTGGPMRWADAVGLQKIVDGLNDQGLEPAKLLVEKAAKGESDGLRCPIC